MAFWTPYAHDSPLDLSKPAGSLMAIKDERLSPVYPVESSVEYPVYGTYTASVDPVPVYCFGQPYQPAYDRVSPYSYTSAGVPVVPTVPVVPMGTYFSRQPSPLLPSPPASLSPVPSSPRLSMEVDYLSDDPDFQSFERDSLKIMAEKNGGALLGNNPRMRRAVKCSKDSSDTYKQQRERNNLAAKLSRDRRKMREIHLSLKVAYLKKQLAELKGQLENKSCHNCQGRIL